MSTFCDELLEGDVVTKKRWFFFFWRRYALASSTRNKVDQDIVVALGKLKGLLAKRKAEHEAFNQRYNHLKKQSFNYLREGRPYKLSRKEAEKRFAAYTESPGTDWMNAFHPLFLREYQIVPSEPGTGNQGQSIKSPEKLSPGVAGKRGAMTLPGLETAARHFGAAHGADYVSEFKTEDNKKGANKGSDADRKQLREKLKAENPRYDGESNEEFGKRISQLLNDAMKDKTD